MKKPLLLLGIFSLLLLGGCLGISIGSPEEESAARNSPETENTVQPTVEPSPAGSAESPAAEEVPAPTPTAKVPRNQPASTEVNTEAQVLTLDSGNLYFSPKDLTVKANQPVTVNYTNKGSHTFTVDELGVNVTLVKASGSFTFTPAKTGTFRLYCAVAGHALAGMEGTLTVVAE